MHDTATQPLCIENELFHTLVLCYVLIIFNYSEVFDCGEISDIANKIGELTNKTACILKVKKMKFAAM